jgi:formate dehydrogenase major subunit/formate dehydrogenase alpha subunit
LAFVTGPVLFQCGTLTTYSEDLARGYGKTLIEISPADAKAAGIASGDGVIVTSASGRAKGEALVTRNVPNDIVFAPTHFAADGVNNLFGAEEGGEMVFVKIEKA